MKDIELVVQPTWKWIAAFSSLELKLLGIHSKVEDCVVKRLKAANLWSERELKWKRTWWRLKPSAWSCIWRPVIEYCWLKIHAIFNCMKVKSCIFFVVLSLTVGDCIKPNFYPNFVHGVWVENFATFSSMYERWMIWMLRLSSITPACMPSS